MKDLIFVFKTFGLSIGVQYVIDRIAAKWHSLTSSRETLAKEQSSYDSDEYEEITTFEEVNCISYDKTLN